MEGCVTNPRCLVIVPLRSIEEEQVIYNDFDITAFFTGIIVIFIKCNHKLQCLIKKFRSCFSNCNWLMIK